MSSMPVDSSLNEPTNLDYANEKSTQNDAHEDSPVDSGYAWVIMAASLIINCCSWGLNASFTIFLNYYLTHNSIEGATDLDFTFICGIAFGFGQAGSPLAVYICNFIPHRVVVLIGSALIAAAFVGGSFAHTITQLYMTLGVLQGVGICLVYIPSSALVPHWFKTRLGLANGIANSGTGLGGVIFTLAAHRLVTTMDVNWAMRILGIAASVGCAVAGLFCKPPTNGHMQTQTQMETRNSKVKMWDARIFKRPDILCVIFWTALGNFSNAIVLFAMASFATSIGLTSSQGTIVSTCTDIGSIVGRPILGMLLDYYGNFNISLIYTMASGILVFAFWIPCQGFAALCILCFLLGNFLSFSAVGPSPVTTSIMGDIDFGSIYSVTWFFTGVFSIFSVPAVNALKMPTLPKPFIWSQVFTGLCFFIAFAALLFARQQKVKQLMKKVKLGTHELPAISGTTPETPDTLYEQDICGVHVLNLNSLEGDTPCETEGTDYFNIKINPPQEQLTTKKSSWTMKV